MSRRRAPSRASLSRCREGRGSTPSSPWPRTAVRMPHTVLAPLHAAETLGDAPPVDGRESAAAPPRGHPTTSGAQHRRDVRTSRAHPAPSSVVARPRAASARPGAAPTRASRPAPLSPRERERQDPSRVRRFPSASLHPLSGCAAPRLFPLLLRAPAHGSRFAARVCAARRGRRRRDAPRFRLATWRTCLSAASVHRSLSQRGGGGEVEGAGRRRRPRDARAPARAPTSLRAPRTPGGGSHVDIRDRRQTPFNDPPGVNASSPTASAAATRCDAARRGATRRLSDESAPRLLLPARPLARGSLGAPAGREC